MGISRRNPRGNFNWQSRILKKKAQCCGQLDEPLPPPPPTIDCYCYTITAVAGTCSVSYVDCSGVPQVVSSGRDPVYICAQEGTVSPACLAPANSVNITGGTCVCDGTPAPDPLPPIGVISGATNGICGASNVNYSLSTSGADCYNWILPDEVTPTGLTNLNSINVSFTTSFVSGTITVEVYYGCVVQTASIVVEGKPPVPTLDPAIICPEASELYTASSTGATSYNWTITGDDFSTCTNPPTCSQYLIIWGISGGSITVTAENACGISDPLTITTSPSCP